TLDPTCALFNKTKAAWDAVSVPAQSGDPTCTGNPGPDFSISVNPTSGSVLAGASVSATVGTTVTSGSAQTVALTATGQPADVSVTLTPSSVQSGASATLTATAAANAANGTYVITVTGTGPSATHSAQYTLTVGNAPPGNAIRNGDFEQGTANWTQSANDITNSNPGSAHGGSWYAWMMGYGSTATETVSQSNITIPAGSPSLRVWIKTTTQETGNTVYDTLKIKIGSTTLATYSNVGATGAYVQRTVNLSAYAGQTVTLTFAGAEDSSLTTTFLVDDVSIS
ncbi:hypothetical protein ACIBM5_46835, partial [Embleya sp. NPDC050493]